MDGEGEHTHSAKKKEKKQKQEKKERKKARNEPRIIVTQNRLDCYELIFQIIVFRLTPTTQKTKCHYQQSAD